MARASLTQIRSGIFSLSIDMGELIQKLDELPDVVRGRLVKGVLRAALQPMLVTAKALAPVETGQLKKNIKMRAGARSRTKINVLISSRAGKSEVLGKGGYYGYFVDSGFQHYLSKKMVAGQHYMEMAFDQHEAEAVSNIEEWLKEGITSYFA